MIYESCTHQKVKASLKEGKIIQCVSVRERRGEVIRDTCLQKN